jgi:hypothetical protein
MTQTGALMKIVAVKPVKPLNPRSSDTNVMGMEPTWKVQPTEFRISALSKAFTWYNYFYGKKDARDLIVHYLETHDRKADVRLLKGIPDSAVRLTTGWLCRMTMVGLELNEHEQLQLESQLREILDSKQDEVADVVEDTTPRVTIQDRLREKTSECNGEIDGLFDEFLLAGSKMTADFKPIVLMRGLNIAPQMISQISDNWKRKLEEFERVVEGKDSQLVEGYSHLSKIQLRNVIKFCEAVINDCGAYVQIKKVERKPRKVKAVPPEKKAAKFKICADFPELKLKSLPAAQLVDKSEAWLYDSKKRKLIHIVADEYAKAFTVKNNSIIGFSTVETVQKTLRKPAEQLKAITGAGKPAARKLFKDIKATETAWNGRGTEHLMVLRVW